MHRCLPILVWALSYALGLVAVRAWVLAQFGVFEFDHNLLLGSAVRLPGHLVIGGLLGALIVTYHARRLLPFLPVVAFVAINIVAIYYEALLGELPGPEALNYISETEHLRSSVVDSGLLGWAAAQCIGLNAALFVVSLLVCRVVRTGARRSSRRDWVAAVVLTVALAAAVVLQFKPRIFGAGFAWAARLPIAYYLSASGPPPLAVGPVSQDKARKLQFAIGRRPALATGDPAAPLCESTKRQPSAVDNPRSVIVLLVEGLGQAELQAKVGDRWVTPNLRRIAKAGLSHTRVYATGTQSCQALPALFAGQPGDTAGLLLWQRPQPFVSGYPKQLKRHGYKTAYFHGGDLSFDHQRSFIKMVGFDQLVEFDPLAPSPVVGWGYPDGQVFNQLKAWLETQHQKTAPYFVSLATLSSHHPYTLPKDWVPRLGPQGKGFFESLHYTDHQLGLFYDWYLKQAKAKGTVLVITGDHAPLGGNTRAIATGEPLRFDVPLLIVGEGIRARVSQRLGSHADLPATLGGIIGVPPDRCDLGVDLRSSKFPDQRIVYGVGGRNLNQLYLWTPSVRGRYLVREASLGFSSATKLEGQARKAAGQRLMNFVHLLLPISHYRMTKHAYAPSERRQAPRRRPTPRVSKPILVSHRGNTERMLPFGQGNRAAAFSTALQAGFDWIEVDVNISRDGTPVLLHDPTITDATGQKLRIEDLTLEQIRALPDAKTVMTLEQLIDQFGSKLNLCIELKRQLSIEAAQKLATQTVRLIRRARQAKRLKQVIVDSFDLNIARMVKRHCNCTVANDLPFRRKVSDAMLERTVAANLDYIYVHHHVVDAELIRRAHARGLKVMVYTVNSKELPKIERLKPEWPDGIITDQVSVKTAILADR